MNRLLLVVCAFLGLLQPAQAQQVHPFSPAELEAMLAPIALYPDPVLRDVLDAARYPGQVIDAASRMPDPGWAPSVQRLLAYPELLQQMAQNQEWLLDLGSASIGQPHEVIGVVALLRQRAQTGPAPLPHVYRVPPQPRIVYVPVYVRPRPVFVSRVVVPPHVEKRRQIPTSSPAYVRVPESQRKPIVSSQHHGPSTRLGTLPSAGRGQGDHREAGRRDRGGARGDAPHARSAHPRAPQRAR